MIGMDDSPIDALAERDLNEHYQSSSEPIDGVPSLQLEHLSQKTVERFGDRVHDVRVQIGVQFEEEIVLVIPGSFSGFFVWREEAMHI